jgi:hypothetical protein
LMRDAGSVRTTLNLDKDVLEAARAIAAQKNQSLGEVVSACVRRAIEPMRSGATRRNGIPLFPAGASARTVTPELVKELLEEVP